ncbi:MAG: GNAT family N-acetyltransferase [Bacteroidetes bacterium]|nr:GNAT family N-acetyltransferase [Bacteroidota bacterium]
MSFVIRQGIERDVPGILALIKELATFEHAPDAVKNTEKMLAEDGFGTNSIYKVIIAEDLKSNAVIGMALYYMAYSTWKGRIYYLDDLIVTESSRGYGVGRQLMDAFLKEARQAKVNQVRWQVLDWNIPAIEFYKKMRVELDSEWINCKMTHEQITRYLEKP